MPRTAPINGAGDVARSKTAIYRNVKFPRKARLLYAMPLAAPLPWAANLAEEISLFSDSAAARLTGLAKRAVEGDLYRATAILAAEGVSLRNIWAIEDLVECENFARIAKELRSHVPSTVLLTLRIAAEYWIQVTPLEARLLEAISVCGTRPS